MNPERSKVYLDFVRSLSCARCLSSVDIEASHYGPRGLGQKTSDYYTAPLCSRCHRLFDGREGKAGLYWDQDRESANKMHEIYICETMILYLKQHRKNYLERAIYTIKKNKDDLELCMFRLKEIVKEARSYVR